jgi:hypothetical protein
MSDKPHNDGGPAFPAEVGSDGDFIQTGTQSFRVPGMTLRDYFAAKAMQGLIAGSGNNDGAVDYKEDAVVQSAYSVADAMLLARNA